MISKVTYRPDAEEDVEERQAFYYGKSPEIGRDFRQDLMETIEAIQRQPKMCAIEFKQFRATTIGKFQDVLYYRAYPDEILIVAIIHGRRDPRAIQKRLS